MKTTCFEMTATMEGACAVLGLDRLRDQIRSGAFDRVIMTEPSRLARNYVHQMLLVEEFEQGG